MSIQSFNHPSRMTLHRLQPQYYTEEYDEAVVWLRTPESRAGYVLSVADGLLCVAGEEPLSSDGAGAYIFVVDGGGAVLVAKKQDHHSARLNGTLVMHHSSLVAGGPVGAAGEMVVHRGVLLSINNWSGHYAPPPSTLRVLLDTLAKMGVANLKSIEIEVTECGGRRAFDKHSDDDESCVSMEWDPAQALKSEW